MKNSVNVGYNAESVEYVHTHTCECLDALLRATICKHIHLVHMTTIDTGRQIDYSYQ